MLSQGPCESHQPLLASHTAGPGQGALSYPLSLAHHGYTMPCAQPCSGQVCREPIWQLGTRLPASFTCMITTVRCSFAAGKLSAVIPLHLIHRFLLLLMPSVILTARRQAEIAPGVFSDGTNPRKAMTASSSLFQSNSSDLSDGISTTFTRR